MNAVDTNVLLYVHDPRDPRKQAMATTLVAALTDAVLFWQVACEYVAASRKLAPLGFRQDDAWRELLRLQSLWNCVTPQWPHLSRCQTLIQTRSLSFWDALLIGAALESGVQKLYSEDLVGIGNIPGIDIINPFAP
jgi:predicted nucleic acid-binding protein